MTSVEHPVTRSELREELRRYATKEDLSEYRAELREELSQLRSEVREELSQHRSEVREELGQLRSEVREELGQFRSEVREELRHYATKEDVANLEVRLTREISDLKTEFGEFKVEVAELRTELKGEISTLIKWMVGVQVGGIAAIGVIATAVFTFARLSGG